MRGPTTQLDPRFSAPDTTPTAWSDTRSVLEDAQLSWISTVRADGRPHVTPLVAVWRDHAAYFTTGPDEQKAINLSHNPHVVLTTGCNTWDDGLDVMIEGRAHRVTDQALLRELASGWAAKWDGSWQFTPAEEGLEHEHGVAHVYRVRPDKILAFGKNPYTHTRHLFPS